MRTKHGDMTREALQEEIRRLYFKDDFRFAAHLAQRLALTELHAGQGEEYQTVAAICTELSRDAEIVVSIWLVRDGSGRDRALSPPQKATVAALMQQVHRDHLLFLGTEPPEFPSEGDESLARYREPRHVVVEVQESGGSLAIGFYEVEDVRPKDVDGWFAPVKRPAGM